MKKRAERFIMDITAVVVIRRIRVHIPSVLFLTYDCTMNVVSTNISYLLGSKIVLMKCQQM